MKISSRVVDVALTPEARERGLMDRRALYGTDGMLFVFDRPTTAPFWNQRTLLPLDLLFADETGRVTDRVAMQTIHESNGQVMSYAPRGPYRMALEILRGRAPLRVHRIALSPVAQNSAQRVLFLYSSS